jgi:hypothetical protein
MTTGEELYNVYGESVGFKNFQGNPMPKWEDLPLPIKIAWQAVADAQKSRFVPEGRELSQIWHALDYAENHAGSGAPGHGQFMLIAKLAKALGYTYGRD